MTTISIDAMGGDYGLDVTVPATIKALKLDKDLTAILVGDESLLKQSLLKHNATSVKERVRIQHASEVVAMDESPALALKKKKDSSMRVAINLVKEGESDAAVSAGNTGALMATARFVLKMLPGIERPAICAQLPTLTGSVHMLDLGANVDSTPEMLLQFAHMGSEICKVTNNIKEPKVSLLNIGSEAVKGNAVTKETAKILSNSTLNYQGFIEGDEIFTDKADIVVCDGFEGNIALKSSEGVAHLVTALAKEEFLKNPLRKLVALLATPIFKSIKKRMDPSRHNGATLAGLRGVVIKSHGGTNIEGFISAIHVAVEEAKLQLPERILAAVSKLNDDLEEEKTQQPSN